MVIALLYIPTDSMWMCLYCIGESESSGSGQVTRSILHLREEWIHSFVRRKLCVLQKSITYTSVHQHNHERDIIEWLGHGTFFSNFVVSSEDLYLSEHVYLFVILNGFDYTMVCINWNCNGTFPSLAIRLQKGNDNVSYEIKLFKFTIPLVGM